LDFLDFEWRLFAALQALSCLLRIDPEVPNGPSFSCQIVDVLFSESSNKDRRFDYLLFQNSRAMFERSIPAQPAYARTRATSIASHVSAATFVLVERQEVKS
jgi:hypothetical protein